MKLTLIITIFVLRFAETVAAGPLEDADAAVKRRLRTRCKRPCSRRTSHYF